MIVPRKRQESQTSFNVKIKRRNKENTPVVQSNASILLNQINSPGRSPNVSRIRDFVSPAPISTFKKNRLARTKRDLTVIKTNIQKKIYG